MSTELVRADKEPAQRPVAIGLAAVAGVLTIIWRLIPHPANCLPLGAMGIHGGAKLRGWKPFLFPLAVLVISDIALWVRTDFDMQYLFHLSRIYVYGSFLIYVLIGRMLRGRESVLAIGGASLLGSLDPMIQPLDRIHERISARRCERRDIRNHRLCAFNGCGCRGCHRQPLCHA